MRKRIAPLASRALDASVVVGLLTVRSSQPAAAVTGASHEFPYLWGFLGAAARRGAAAHPQRGGISSPRSTPPTAVHNLNGMDPVLATLLILGAAIVSFASNRIPLGVVAIGVALALYLTGVLGLEQALAGFGDPTVVFIATLFVVSEALESTGITAWAGQQIIGRAGTRRGVLLVVVCLLAAALAAFISPNGAVAALYPIVAIVAARAGLRASQLLLPLAFAAHAGSLLLLTGTPVSIIVSEVAAESGGRAFGFLEFALVGIPLLVGSILIMLAGGRLIPRRAGAAMPFDIARHARLLREQYAVGQETGPLLGPRRGITEVLVPPRSPLIGATLTPGMATPSGDLILLAARRGATLLAEREFVTQAGDTLLLQGSWEDLDRHTSSGRVLPIDAPQRLRRAVPLGRGARRTLVILGAMVVLLATGIVPPAIATLAAAAALVLTRAIAPAQAYRSISWTTVVLVAGMIPLSTAFLTTGTADLVARGLLGVIGDAGPTVVLLALCLLTLVLGQVISNVATVLIVAPIAVSIAASLDLSVQPFMMALTVMGAASFLTPIATPANLMVLEPGGYRFGDYWRLGLPLAGLFLITAVLYVPLLWPFG